VDVEAGDDIRYDKSYRIDPDTVGVPESPPARKWLTRAGKVQSRGTTL